MNNRNPFAPYYPYPSAPDAGTTPPGGNATRASGRTSNSVIKAATKDLEDVIAGPFTRLVGIQTGVSGFVLRSLKSETASALSGTQKDFSVVDQDGTTYYFTTYPTKA